MSTLECIDKLRKEIETSIQELEQIHTDIAPLIYPHHKKSILIETKIKLLHARLKRLVC